ncbi:MAG: hypothetical protein ABW203_03530, partial [Novosphingobium sp.]
RADPPVAVKWQPHAVWMSCDGSYGVTRGAWQGPKASGGFTTVWQRQKDGTFKWVLDQGEPLAAPLPAPEMIAGKVAECTPRPDPAPDPATAAPEPAAGDVRTGRSRDGTLTWVSSVAADNRASLVVRMWNGQRFEEVLRTESPAG